jgi:hypothetical protein
MEENRFNIVPEHTVTPRNSDIPELRPEIGRRLGGREFDEVFVQRSIEKLRFPTGFHVDHLYAQHTHVYLTKMRVEGQLLARSVNGAEGSTLEVDYCNADTAALQYIKLLHGRAANIPENIYSMRAWDPMCKLVVRHGGMIGAVWVQPSEAPGQIEFLQHPTVDGRNLTLRIVAMDPRHQRTSNVQVTKSQSDREIVARMGPLSNRPRSQGPQDPPGEQKYRGYTP